VLYRHILQKSAKGMPMQTAYSEAAPPRSEAGEYGESEFLRTVAGADEETAWLIMDELMSTLQLVNSRAYDSVMRKIRNISAGGYSPGAFAAIFIYRKY
jgi:hypothetical protein